ncbi:Nif3-like dinuclear metal center hexameric protein [Aliidiomarina iranensis]|uniref:GTP cyclohydrolase 1 type 2 homolog n=1 Tax=Aliidiomarina iranensis TaxID=1434071 RepID=A0A432VZY1_9GAMM|nr:Nif3-like dinuclear metal center hexameric protein [Aliidiomarina iranensis]RUO22310.1 Nif3-like dinuclear metal center hexameric protein [Aliidiomarina iranensis]
MQRNEFLNRLNEWLIPEQVQDYCPNGLQVEGRESISHLVTGVTASQALVDAAVAAGADALLVHHGYFWKGESQPIIGMKRKRIGALLAADMNLFAYHLPLDIHPDFGNNAQLLGLLGVTKVEPVTGMTPTGILQIGTLSAEISGTELAQRLTQILNRELVATEISSAMVKRIAVCTGGGQGFIEDALAAGADVFITGEVSEQTIHVARECGIQFIAAGHHATERYGVKALGEKIAAEMGLKVTFIDIDNPA